VIASLRAELERALGRPVERAHALAGGDVNDAFEVVLPGGMRIFVKTHRAPPAGMYEAEARGLAWLSQAAALRVPRVLATGSGETPFLALEFLDSGAPSKNFDEALGRGLATLHRAGAPSFGLDHDNFIGNLSQPNGERASWLEFFRDQRLGMMLELARKKGRASTAMERGFERLFARLETLLGPPEPPARLHGDLWSGNLHVGPAGEPCLIDPAVYGGHREVDLAMMRLFGGFSSRVFAAYDEAFPLAAGHAERVQLYQLYPLLVHVNLFGGSYVASVERALLALTRGLG
jgi:fructosamine-3-kinase